MQITTFLALTSSILFLFYGILCFVSPKLVLEFTRYGYEKYRKLIATVEIMGATGLVLGLFYVPLMLISSGGFVVLMLGAIFVRIKIKDPFFKWLPALFLLIVNFILFIESTSRLIKIET